MTSASLLTPPEPTLPLRLITIEPEGCAASSSSLEPLEVTALIEISTL